MDTPRTFYKMNIFFVKILLCCFFPLLLAFGDNNIENKELAKNPHTLKLLDKGKSDSYQWSLYESPSKRNSLDLILMVRNTGAKWIDLEGVTSKDIVCKSSDGSEMKIWRASEFYGIANKDLMVVHLYIEREKITKGSYTLELKKKADAFVPVSFKTKPITHNG